METKIFPVKGMHCASCVATITKTLLKTDGVSAAEVNIGTETAKVTYDHEKVSPEHLSEKIKPLGYSLVVPTAAEMGHTPNEHAAHLGMTQTKEEKLAEVADMKRKVISVIPLAVFSIVLMTWEILVKFSVVGEFSNVWKEFFHHLLPIFATYTLFVVGKPYLLGLYRFLRFRKANMDSLIGIGTVAAFVYSFVVSAFEESLRPFVNVDAMYYDVTIVVIMFITLGKYLEAKAKIKTGDAIEKLLNLQAKTALVVRDGREQEVQLQAVVIQDQIIVKPGSHIPVDGVIVEGSSYIDESLVTGESMPVEKNVGDTVVAGTINTSGSFTFTATKVGAATLLGRIIKMVEEAQGSRAPIQALADKISAVFVPVVMAIAFVTLGVWLFVGTPILGFSQALSFGLTSFVGILVIACPCALGLATPTAIMVGVGKGAREGILIKDAATLELLHKVTVVVVDKTGTITRGKPELVGFQNFSSFTDEKMVAILASLEKKSEHPIAHAIIAYALDKKITPFAVTQFESIKGKGLRGVIEGEEYYAGNTKLIAVLGISFDAKLLEEETSKGRTPIILATAREVLGVVMVADAVKPESKQAISDLHALGIKTVMLTGDMKHTALAIAREVGIDEVIAEVSPEDKLKKIKKLKHEGAVVAMAGDGVNDAPALAAADIGIAMGTGSDTAIETAGITLLGGDMSKIVKAIRLSKLTMRGIKQNLFWAFFYNVVGIPLAAGVFYPVFGWLLNPIFAGLAMAFSSVSVVGNSLRLKAKKL